MIKRLRDKKFYLPIAGLALILAVFLIATAFSNKDVVASVNGDSISKEELYSTLVKQYGASSLSALIDNKIIEQEAEKKDITVTDKEITEELQTYIDSYGGEEAFQSALEQSGLTENDVKSDVENYLKIEKLLKPQVKVTEEEMKTYFEENKESFNEQEQVEASHILVDDKKTAEEVAQKLADGQGFAELAKEYSTDASNAESGGELGYFSKGEMAAEFEEVAFSMAKGEISDLVKTEYGYHIIKVTDKKAAKEAVYEDHKEDIKEILFDQKLQSEYATWLQEKKDEAEIENTLED
ncbi:peptidylprolyl isomerase [Mesobacillus foraminis]|uniref:peptidylprolyl isomerase n=1 Tax=Mesobacillus foraminis TaxID=279826 RepID=UPI001BE8917F|nr:peptidylprolyl isomerase [Mesobacillus foraminis]MBT2756269.1 peptidylprolyl isomerase [Mesobacillus foraminis]